MGRGSGGTVDSEGDRGAMPRERTYQVEIEQGIFNLELPVLYGSRFRRRFVHPAGGAVLVLELHFDVGLFDDPPRMVDCPYLPACAT